MENEKQPTEKIQTTWPEFRKHVFEKSMQIVEDSNCHTFKIMGYKYLDIRLILYFHDCNEVFEWSLIRGEIKLVKFFTNDKDREKVNTEMGEFKSEIERDLPEVKV